MSVFRSSKQLSNVSSSGGCSSRSTQRWQTTNVSTHIITPSGARLQGNGMLYALLLFSIFSQVHFVNTKISLRGY